MLTQLQIFSNGKVLQSYSIKHGSHFDSQSTASQMVTETDHRQHSHELTRQPAMAKDYDQMQLKQVF